MNALLSIPDTMKFFPSAATWLLATKQRVQRQRTCPEALIAPPQAQPAANQPEYLTIAMEGVNEQFDAIMARLDRIESKVDQLANSME